MEHFYQNIQGWFNYQGLYSSLVESANSPAHFVEVGVWKGTSAAYMTVEIANSGKAIQFDCVDTFQGSTAHRDPDQSCYEPLLITDPDWLYNTFVQNMQPVQSYYNARRMSSVDAAATYTDSSLDFVFIDAEHTYPALSADLQAWYPKIKNGGTIGGHDYSILEDVRQAVQDFFGPLGLDIHVADNDSWVVYKP